MDLERDGDVWVEDVFAVLERGEPLAKGEVEAAAVALEELFWEDDVWESCACVSFDFGVSLWLEDLLSELESDLELEGGLVEDDLAYASGKRVLYAVGHVLDVRL